MKIKRLIALSAAILLLGGIAACTSSRSGSAPDAGISSANAAESANAGAGLDLVFTNQPAPIFAYSAYRQQLIEIEAVEALGTPTTAFFFPPGWNGSGSHPFRVCPAQGLPIPNSTELDNPQEVVQDPYGGGYNLNNGGLVKPQADPIGVYTPTTGTGTYVTCVGLGGTLNVSYWEGDVYAESAPAIWNSSEGMIQDIGKATLPQCSIVTARKGDDPLHVTYGTTYEHCVPAPATRSYIWGSRTASGSVIRLDRAETLVVSCSMKTASYYSQQAHKIESNGLVSTCQFPGATLTFAPWGIVSSASG